jgi:diguanylate cyclase (GGDEF)-like protein
MNLLGAIGFPLFLVSATEVLLGFLLVLRNPRKDPAVTSAALLAFFSAAYSLSAGIAYVRASVGLSYDLFLRICWVGWLGIAAGLQFIYYMKGSGRTARMVGWVLYPLMAVVLGLCIFTDLVEAGAVSLMPFVDRAAPLENPLRLAFGLLLFWALVELIRLRRLLVGVKRVQLNYFLLGMILYAACAGTGAGILQLFDGMGFDPALASYFSLPFVALTFYAITRYRLFDIQIVISRAVAALLLFVVLGAVHIAVFRLLEPATGSTLALLIALVLIGVLIFETPLSRRMHDLIDRLIVGGKYDYQEILKNSTRALVTILEVDELLEYITEVIKKSLRVERVCLFTRGDAGGYRLRFGPGVREKLGEEFVLQNGAISWIKKTGRTLIREEHERQTGGDPPAVSDDLDALGAELVIPMFYKGEMKGALTLGPKGNQLPYVRSDIELLESLAAQAAIAMENAQLYEAAVRDSLTGLFHQRYFKLRVKEEVERSRRYGHPLALLMVDIDRFKRANDEYGHLVGDNIIKGVANVLQQGARMGDVVARYGGDEFAVLLPETSRQTASEVADRLRMQVEKMKIGDLGVTVSIGVASTEAAERSLDLIRQADGAMYRAKRNGKNRVELAA